jgi:rubrerythrin
MLRLARVAGVGGPALGLLQGRLRALPKSEDTDLSVLYAAIALEHQAIAVYEHGLRRAAFPPGLKPYAVEFRGDHLGHRDTQVAIAEERGGRAPDPRISGEPVLHGDDLLRHALRIEIAAQQAYSALISQIRTKDYRLSAAFILIDEVRHETVWRRVLGLSIY